MVMCRQAFLATICVLALAVPSFAGTVARNTKPSGGSDWVSGDTVTPTDLNGDFNTIYNEFNGSVDDANIGTLTTTSITGCVGGTCSNPLGLEDVDDYSTNEAEANNDSTPGISGTPSLATDGEGEVEIAECQVDGAESCIFDLKWK